MVASCNVRAEPILVMCVRAVHLQAWEVRLQYRTFFGNNENNDDFNLLILLAQKWSILANFGKKKINFGELLGRYYWD